MQHKQIKSSASNRSLFFERIAQTSGFPLALEITDAQNEYLIDKNGRKILDLICGISVSALGHNHPKVVQAVQEQAGKYMHTMVYGEFVLAPQVKLAEELTDLLPEGLDAVYYGSSGSEVIEGALKLAVKATGRRKIIAASRAYHGSTTGAMSLMSDQKRVAPFAPHVNHVRHIEYNNPQDLDRIDTDTAAVIMETIQAESGVKAADIDYMRALRKKCDETGALLIFDEIQAGMCRTGRFFAFEHFGIQPDILVLSKAFGGGMPLGALVSSQELLHVFTANPILGHITTFGGHPVSCAAGLASLRIMRDERLWDRAARLSACLDPLSAHNKVKEFRKFGFWAAVDLGSMDLVLKVVEKALKKGMLVDWFLFNDHSLRLCPPLIIGEDVLRDAIDGLLEILDELH
ncbi:MAG TPA: aspartate aminotransferase family protein [Saprospiraceae bacterium]|nr:aspartate aminotransferase family protein [Saprospiraceae bacterium]